MTKSFASRVKMPLFKIAKIPKINIGNIKQRRFDLIDRGCICPVCEFYCKTNEFQSHLDSMTDIDHIIYSVHNI